MNTRSLFNHSLTVLCICVLAVSCGRAPERAFEADMTAPRMAEPTADATAKDAATPQAAGNGPQQSQRMMIYTADLRLRVSSVDSSHARIRSFLSGYDAYIVSDNRTTSYAGEIENTMTIRVAQPQFDRLLDAVLKQAVYVDSKDVRSSDVTQEYVDLEARLKSRQLAEEQYREIMKRATKISDVLEVQKYLNEIREEIEAAQGRIRYLQNQAAYSTINVSLYEREKGEVPPEETFFGRLGEAFRTGWEGGGKVIIGLVSLWPFWLMAFLAVYLLLRWSRRQKRQPVQSAAAPVSPETVRTSGAEGGESQEKT